MEVRNMNQYLLANRAQVFASLWQYGLIWDPVIARSLLFASCQEAVLYVCQEAPHPAMWDGLATATALPQSS